MLTANGAKRLTPEMLAKFYSISSIPITLNECNSIFTKLVYDSKNTVRDKQLDSEMFVQMMENFIDKIDNNVERDIIISEIQACAITFMEHNTDCLINLLNLPPDLSQEEVSDLLAAMKSTTLVL